VHTISATLTTNTTSRMADTHKMHYDHKCSTMTEHRRCFLNCEIQMYYKWKENNLSPSCVKYYYTKIEGFNTLLYLNTLAPTFLWHFFSKKMVGECHVCFLSMRQWPVHSRQSELNTYQYAFTFCTMGLNSTATSVGKVSNCKQTQYFVAFYKHASCNI
jgi:hypothetical protein